MLINNMYFLKVSCSLQFLGHKVTLYIFANLFHVFFVFRDQTVFFKLYFLFCIDVQPINNVMVVLGEQPRDSAVHIHGSIHVCLLKMTVECSQLLLHSVLPYHMSCNLWKLHCTLMREWLWLSTVFENSQWTPPAPFPPTPTAGGFPWTTL